MNKYLHGSSATRNRQPGGRTTKTNNGIAHMTGDGGGIQPELLTSPESATLAGVSERTWWSMTRSGLAPPPLKIGCGLRPMVRFRRADILAWIEAGCPRCDGKGGGR
jgi:predicted DNA-binding transcriptional regulator AlpA